MNINHVIESLQGSSGGACRGLDCIHLFSTGKVEVCSVLLIKKLAEMVVAKEIQLDDVTVAKAMVQEKIGIGTYDVPLKGSVFCQQNFDEQEKGTPSSIIRDARMSVSA